MTSDKPEWYSKENEKEPGSPLSRLPEWEGTDWLEPLRVISPNRLRELLAVIDKLEAERIRLRDENIQMCFRTKKRQEVSFEAGWNAACRLHLGNSTEEDTYLSALEKHLASGNRDK